MKVRTRFAPSPTGFMHIGNLRTALYAYLYARHNEGTFILRIEDTDQERYVEGAVDIIYKTLETCKIDYDEGPLKDGGYVPYIQSERKGEYLKYAEELVARGGAYYCFCKKERLDSLADDKGVKKYDKHCLNSVTLEEAEKRIAAGESYVIRQNIPLTGVSEYDDMVFGKISVDNPDMEDNVLIKSDGMPTYNFANVVDDHLMGINTVIRGTEYLSSTPKYNLLYDSFGWNRPVYMHLPPIMKDSQRKLSKRYGDANFDDFVKKGYLPEAIVNYIALLGWSPKDNREKLSMNDLIELFNVDGVSKSGSIFDENKMRWLNSEYVKELTIEEFNDYAVPFYEGSKIAGKYDYRKLSELLHTRVEIFSDIPSKVDFLEEFGDFDTELFIHQRSKATKETSLNAIEKAIPVLEAVTEWVPAEIDMALTSLAEREGVKKGIILWAVRIGITGQQNTPGGATEMADLLGKEATINRLRFSLDKLKKEGI
jgi:glutamyl-tRNA synthetase